VLCRLVRGTWYGWPDYSADFNDITLPRFQPPIELLFNTGYESLPLLVDHSTSGPDGTGLRAPSREALLRGAFPSQSGAAKLAMAPRAGPFEKFYGSAIVALSGDRAPFATSSQKIIGPIGYKVVRVLVDNQQVEDFLRNTRGVPAHRLPENMRDQALERPVDVKFGPDGALYVLDMGRMDVKGGRERVHSRTGGVFRIVPVPQEPAEQRASDVPIDAPIDPPPNGTPTTDDVR
jgi:glucose/arabinose dehydrogenase